MLPAGVFLLQASSYEHTLMVVGLSISSCSPMLRINLSSKTVFLLDIQLSLYDTNHLHTHTHKTSQDSIEFIHWEINSFWVITSKELQQILCPSPPQWTFHYLAHNFTSIEQHFVPLAKSILGLLLGLNFCKEKRKKLPNPWGCGARTNPPSGFLPSLLPSLGQRELTLQAEPADQHQDQGSNKQHWEPNSDHNTQYLWEIRGRVQLFCSLWPAGNASGVLVRVTHPLSWRRLSRQPLHIVQRCSTSMPPFWINCGSRRWSAGSARSPLNREGLKAGCVTKGFQIWLALWFGVQKSPYAASPSSSYEKV